MTATTWWNLFDQYVATSGFMPLDDAQLRIVYHARRAGMTPSAAIVALQQKEHLDARDTDR